MHSVIHGTFQVASGLIHQIYAERKSSSESKKRIKSRRENKSKTFEPDFSALCGYDSTSDRYQTNQKPLPKLRKIASGPLDREDHPTRFQIQGCVRLDPQEAKEVHGARHFSQPSPPLPQRKYHRIRRDK